MEEECEDRAALVKTLIGEVAGLDVDVSIEGKAYTSSRENGDLVEQNTFELTSTTKGSKWAW